MKRTLFLFSIALLSTLQLSATHILGMNISYEHIGGDSFEVVLDFHRYCGGTAFNNGNCTNAAGIGSTSGYYIRCEDNGWQSPYQQAALDTIMDATPICNAQFATQNSCIVGACGLLGIQRGIYRDTLVLDSGFTGGINCDNWILVYSSGARNTGVNYVSQPSIVSYARLDSSYLENSSVRMNPVNPIPVFCEGQDVHYGWSAFDPDGDSLHWELDTAWNNYVNGQFNSINYSAIVGYDTFSGLDPMPGDVTINPNTGELHFVADIPPSYNYANYAIAVTVWEYDQTTGALKGEVHRDIQFIVTDSCDNLPPVAEANFSNLNGVSLVDSITIDACENAGFSFDIIVADYDTSGNLSTDSLTTTTNISQFIPNATWTSTNTNPDTLHVTCPNYNPVFNPVMFTVVAEDNFCPINATRTFTFFLESNCVAFDSFNICEGQWQEINYSNDSIVQLALVSGSPLNAQTYNCLNANCNSFELSPSVTSVYEATVWDVGGSSFLDTFTVEVVNYLISMDTILGSPCVGEEIVFDVDVLNANTFEILWNDSINAISNDSLDSTTVVINQPGWFGFPYIVSSDTNCSASDTLEVQVHGNPIVDAGSDIIVCDGNSFNLLASGANQYVWNPSNGLNDSIGASVTGFISSSQYFSVRGTDNNGCASVDSVFVEIEDNLVTGTVVDSSGNPLDSIVVYFIGFNAAQDSVFLIDSLLSDNLGEFTYESVDSAFLVKGYPFLSLYPNLLPTYYIEEATIQPSEIVYTSYCDTVDITLEMLHGSNVGGAGFIGGLIAQGASRGEAVKGLDVVLTNSQLKPLAHTTSSNLGHFRFDGLIPGTYYVYVDKIGVENGLAPQIVLTDREPAYDSLEFVLYSNRLELVKATGVGHREQNQVRVYPNPADHLISIISDVALTQVVLYTYMGSKVFSSDIQGKSTSIQTDDLNSGWYLIELTNEKGEKSHYRIAITH